MPAVEDSIEEVVNGEIRVMPPNKWESHSVEVDNLQRILSAQFDPNTVRVVATVFGLSREARTVEVLRMSEGALQTSVILQEGQLRPAHSPEAIVDIAAIWGE